jgi:GT2 family glycosyltransferase
MLHPVDVVIPTRDRGALVVPTVLSLLGSRYDHFKVWVVDQSEGSETESAMREVCSRDPRVRYLRSRRVGSSRGRNAGAHAGTSPFILFTDDDCRVDADWLGEMVCTLSEPDVWAVFGRVEAVHSDQLNLEPDPGDEVSPAIRIATKDASSLQRFKGDRFNLGFGHGASMGLTRAAFDTLGGFDELLSNGAELRSWPERDLGYRILKRGGAILYQPAALVQHYHWRGWSEVRRVYRNYGFGAGAAVGKYLRCGDWAAGYLLLTWMADQGVRPILSAIFKWQCAQKLEIGWVQLIYPWLGLWAGLRHSIDMKSERYQAETSPRGAPAHTPI